MTQENLTQIKRKFTIVGSNCVRCNKDCGVYDAYNPDHHAFSSKLTVNGEQQELTFCDHRESPGRKTTKPLSFGENIMHHRICLVKQPDFDITAEVEEPS